MFQSYGRAYSHAAAQAAQADANAAQATVREVGADVEKLRNDVSRLLLISEALWTLLQKQHGYAEEDLVALVQEIDLRDGRLDGKTAKAAPASCPKCGRVNSSKHSACIYCGSPLPVQLFAS